MNNDEYEIIDSNKTEVSLGSKGDESMFCNSQEFFTPPNKSDKDDKSNDESSISNLDISDSEVTNKQNEVEKVKKGRGKQAKIVVAPKRTKRAAAENAKEEKPKSTGRKKTVKKRIKDDSDTEKSCQVDDDSSNTNEHTKDLTEDERKIYDFFYNISRPVNSTELALNFKKQLTTPAMVNVCNNLEAKGLLVAKMYTKTKIYMINPSIFDSSKSDKIQVKLTEIKQINEKLRKEYNSLNEELKTFESMESEEEINKKSEELRLRIVELQERVQLRDEGQLISKKEIDAYNDKIKKYTKINKERNKIINEILEKMCDSMNMKKQDLIRELELEM